MLNSWFTINVVDENVPPLSRKLANENEPIRIKIEGKRNSSVKKSVVTVHTPMQSSGISKQNTKVQISGKMSEERDLSKSKISQNYIQTNYENDRNIRKIIRLIKDKNPAVISRLPPPGKRNSIQLAWTRKTYYTWTNGS